MSKVFISYSRDDLKLVESLEKALKHKAIVVLRDQETIYVGEAWPKSIGEAIASSNLIVLIWSRYSSKSHFVEFEWNTALALRIPIIPIVIDSTPLPPSLSSINYIPIGEIEDIASRILNSLGKIETKPNVKLQSDVIERLSSIKTIEPQEVLEETKTIFKQKGWTLQGNVYQVSGGDINISIQHSVKPEEKKWWTKPLTWISFLIAILTLIGLLLDLPKKISEAMSDEAVTTPLRGRITNNLGNPIEGAILKIDELPGDSVIATSDGGFYFAEVPGKPGDRVRLYVFSKGFKSHNEYVTLPGPITIELNE